MTDEGITQEDAEKMFRQYYGNNYDKGMKNTELGVKRAKLNFKKEYPNADINKFDFSVTVGKTGDIEGTSITYKINKDEGYDITSDTFKKLYSDALYWKPRIWDTGGTYQPFVLASGSLPYNLRERKGCFSSNFDALKTSWEGTVNDITKAAVGQDDPYFASAGCMHYFARRRDK